MSPEPTLVWARLGKRPDAPACCVAVLGESVPVGTAAGTVGVVPVGLLDCTGS